MKIVKLLSKTKLQQVNKFHIDKFELISIRGRFIYGFLCMMNEITYNNSDKLPIELDSLFHEFVSSDKLDDWHSKVEDVIPSYIYDKAEDKSDFFSSQSIQEIKNFYASQPSYIVETIDDLIWLGVSNLYSGFNSEKSLKCLKSILEKMYKYAVPLPSFEIVKDCSVSQRHGWGNSDDLNRFIKMLNP